MVAMDRVPHYRELSVKVLLKEFVDDVNVLSYLPDPGSAARPLNRKFLLQILFSLRPEYMKFIC